MGRAFSELSAVLAGSPGVYSIPSTRCMPSTAPWGGARWRRPGFRPNARRRCWAGPRASSTGATGAAAESGAWTPTWRTRPPTVSCAPVSASGRDPFEAAAALARQLSPGGRALATRSEPALREYAAALESGDAGALERALAADPDFGAAWLRLSAVALAGGGRGPAQAVLEKAVARPLPPLERAAAEAELATLRGDGAARERALAALIQASPADPEPYRMMAAASSAAHLYGRAAGQLRQAAERMPANAVLLNGLGVYRGGLCRQPAGRRGGVAAVRATAPRGGQSARLPRRRERRPRPLRRS